MRSSSSPRRAFTLIELLITVSVSLIVGIVALTLSSSALTLFTKNFSLNESHFRARDVSERASWLLHQCVETPVLVDANGADVASGPAAGVRVLRYAGTYLYRTNAALAPTSTSVILKAIPAGQPVPHVGDAVVIQFQDPSLVTNNSGTIQATATAVSVTGGLTTLTFAKALSNYFTPYTSAVWAIAANQPVNLLTHSSLVSVNNGSGTPELRYYPWAVSVSANGSSTFSNAANYHVLAELKPLTSATQALPFDYSDSTNRRVDMDLRAISTRYSGSRQKEYSFFESIHSSAAYRSAVQKNLQP